MMYTFVRTDFNTIRPQVDAYLAALTGPVDDFWERHVLRADTYAIRREAETVGFFCCLMEDAPRMTAFCPSEKRLAAYSFSPPLKLGKMVSSIMGKSISILRVSFVMQSE